MNEVIEKDNIMVEDLIYEIRGKQVMLDSDLAKLYKCTYGTKDINKQLTEILIDFQKIFIFN